MSKIEKKQVADSFFHACKKLGFQEVKSLQDIVPYTIYRENHTRFMLTVVSDNGSVVVIPVLVFTSLEKRRIRIIEKLVGVGKFVILHPQFMSDAFPSAFAQAGKYGFRRAFIRMLHGAADGREFQVRLFAKVLSKKCEEFLGQKLLGFPQLPSIEECSDDERDHHGACGPAAEENFLKAMFNLGFNIVIGRSSKMHPMSIRCTTHKEEAELKDFIVRISGHRQAGKFKKLMPVIPFQLTLMWYPENKNLKRKLEAEERGDIALIWADESFGDGPERHTNLFQLLKDTAGGQVEALEKFADIFKESCRKYYSRQDNVTDDQIEVALAMISV